MTFVELAIGIGARMAPKNSVISVLSPRITLKVYECIALLLAFGLVVGALVHHAANLPGVVLDSVADVLVGMVVHGCSAWLSFIH